MRVLNKYRDNLPSDVINIMRPNELGNPFVVGKDGTRDEVCDKHMEYARERLENDSAFAELVLNIYDHDVVCCCAPARCHGDNLIILAKELHEKRNKAMT